MPAPYLSGTYLVPERVPAGSPFPFDHGVPRVVGIEETSHWRLTRSVLEHPARFWKALREEGTRADPEERL